MKINEDLLRKYIFHVQVLNEHTEAMAETYLEEAYDDEEELKADLSYCRKRINKIKEFEKELLKELNKVEE